ncbi:MAG: xanthine dehydrogenase family protein molybdopterin-binding subunit [Ardenticatenaceae bacterium]|nr:xanthine dehydrogenase family protein molybdopterin-binding subunit [Ardenticatenaceae bacterium]
MTFAHDDAVPGTAISASQVSAVGRGLPLSDGREKVTGQIKYTGDLVLPGMVYARPILSPYAHARIISIDGDAARRVPGVVAVVTAADLPAGRPATNRNSAILAGDRVVFQGQPVAVVIAESEASAADGAELVAVEYEPLPPVVDPLQALQADAPLVWPGGIPKEADGSAEAHAGAAAHGEQTETRGNVAGEVHFRRGSIVDGFAAADVVVEHTYQTHAVHQGYLEPHASVAAIDPASGALTLWTATQGPFGVRDEVAKLLGLPRRKVRIVPMAVGGGFGAKYGILEPLVGALALHLNRPVRMVLTRIEDFQTTTPSPACTITLKTGANRDGRLTALEANVVLDSGAFVSGLLPVVCNILGGYYRVLALEIRGVEVITTKPMAGAYRAPTGPQATFAIESQMDEMARQLNLDPLQFRLQNAIESGDPMPDGAAWPSVGLKACLDQVERHPLWQAHRAGTPGIGLAIGGWPGGTAPAAAVCRLDSDGTIFLHVGSVDITGSDTSLTLIAAECLGVPLERITILARDTDLSPIAGPAGGSMTTYTVGAAVLAAAQAARQQILAVAAELLEAGEEDLELRDGQVAVRGAPSRRVTIDEVARKTTEVGGRYQPIIAQGRSALATQAPSFTAQLAQITVNEATGRVRVVRNVIFQDVGRAINPLLIEGQIHGGAAQGLGWGLFEQMVYDENSQLLSASLLDYTLPTTADVPPFEVVLIENPSPNGPLGARPVGEPPILAGAPAIANAIRDVTGARVTELPITSERLWRALQADGKTTARESDRERNTHGKDKSA